MDFSKMTVAKLKEYAEENGIDIDGAKTKTAILSVITQTKSSISAAEDLPKNVISSESIVKQKRPVISNARSNKDGIITVGSADNFKNKEFKKEEKTPDNKVAIFSEKNMHSLCLAVNRHMKFLLGMAVVSVCSYYKP